MEKRKYHRLVCILVGSICIGAPLAMADEMNDQFRVWADNVEDRPLVYFENDLYQAVLVPELAMFPLFYFHKPSGGDFFIRRPEIERAFSQGDGLQFCLPWVGDTVGDHPSKGLLHSAEWQTSFDSDGKEGWLEARTEIDYTDPLSKIPCRLTCSVRVSGEMGSSVLTIKTQIANTGDSPAKFMFAAHARLAPDGMYRSGDFLLLDADRAWVGDSNWPPLEALGVKPHSWTEWPIPGVSPFLDGSEAAKRGEFIYAFLPATRLIAGNPVAKSLLLLDVKSMKINGKPVPSYFCILRRHGDYLVEVSASRAIDVKHWADEGGTMELEPGASLTIVLGLSAEAARSAEEAAALLLE